MTSAGGSDIVMLLCIYCLQLRKLTQVPIKSAHASAVTAARAKILCTFKSLLSQAHNVGKETRSLEFRQGLCRQNPALGSLLQFIQVKKLEAIPPF